MASSWIFGAAIAVLCVGHVLANCALRHTTMNVKQPLLLADNGYTDARRLMKSDATGYVNLKTGESITLACPGSYNYMTGGNALPWQMVTATCSSGYNLVVDGRTISLSSVTCYTEPYHDILLGRQLNCGGTNSISLEVGFNLPGLFLKMYEVCFDQSTLSALSSQHYVVSGLRNARTGTLSSYLFAPVDPATAYVRSTQNASLALQLGSQSAARLISTTNYFEAKQLVPSADFVFGPTQMATYFYFNTVSLWRMVSSAYWSTMESAIRTLTNTEGDLQVSTTISGTLTLSNDDGIPVPVFLHATSQERKMRIPVSVAKSVTNAAKEQVIFLQVLNKGEVSRALDEVQSAEGVCAEDVCAQLRWLPWRHVPPSERPVVCCRADDPQLLRNLPQLQKQSRSGAPAGLLVGSKPEGFYA